MKRINFKESLRLTTHTIPEECTEATFFWHQWIQLKKEQLSDKMSVFSSQNLGCCLNAFHTEWLDSKAVGNIMHIDVVRMNIHFWVNLLSG